MASLFGMGRPQPSSAEKIAAAEQEMDLVTDMFNKYVPMHQASVYGQLSTVHEYLLTSTRLTRACMKKCIPNEYREGELNKGEGVCIDRCSAKFFEVQMKVSEILQNEAQAKGAGAPGGGLGFGGM
jgi:import inner membrane translocase subunit TIM10